jgi:hypothetical protein
MHLHPIWGKAMAETIITLDLILRVVHGPSFHCLAICHAYLREIATRVSDVWMGGKLRDDVFQACEPVAGESRETGS